MLVAQDVLAGEKPLKAMHAAFAKAIVYVRRPGNPGVFVTQVPGQGRWTLAFSSLERLAAHAGGCEYVSMPGADLLGLVPAGVGVMVDPADEHRFPVLTRVEGPDVLLREWTRAAWVRQSNQQEGRA